MTSVPIEDIERFWFQEDEPTNIKPMCMDDRLIQTNEEGKLLISDPGLGRRKDYIEALIDAYDDRERVLNERTTQFKVRTEQLRTRGADLYRDYTHLARTNEELAGKVADLETELAETLTANDKLKMGQQRFERVVKQKAKERTFIQEYIDAEQELEELTKTTSFNEKKAKARIKSVEQTTSELTRDYTCLRAELEVYQTGEKELSFARKLMLTVVKNDPVLSGEYDHLLDRELKPYFDSPVEKDAIDLFVNGVYLIKQSQRAIASGKEREQNQWESAKYSLYMALNNDEARIKPLIAQVADSYLRLACDHSIAEAIYDEILKKDPAYEPALNGKEEIEDAKTHQILKDLPLQI